jgi:DNA polymerase-3 subunit alpha/error-prone DNA polymerase
MFSFLVAILAMHPLMPVTLQLVIYSKIVMSGDVMAKDLLSHHKKTLKMLAYIISRKHVPTKMGTMYFGTWVDTEGEYFDTGHFTKSLEKYPFQGGGCYLPFISDPRYSNTSDRQYKVHQQIREDVSMTHRAPYPQEHQINLPRHKMEVGAKKESV